MRNDLQQKGVRAEVIEEAVGARYGETNEETLAREYLSRKRIPKPESPKDTARVVRRLMTAGFATGTIYKILRRWDVPEEELAGLENMEAETGKSEAKQQLLAAGSWLLVFCPGSSQHKRCGHPEHLNRMSS